MQNDFQLTSSAFADGDEIPDKYTCKGENVSPPLNVHGVPDDAAGLALVMHDPDAPNGDFLHWTVWNLNADLTSIAENSLPDNAVQGATDFGSAKYGGPCPPSGTHRYEFDLYALDAPLNLPAGAPRQDVENAISDHKIAETKLTGTVSAQ